MGLKVVGKAWSCSNQCGTDCCSEVFLPIDAEQQTSLEERGWYIAPHDYTEWRWLKFHKAFTVEKMSGGDRKIWVKKAYEIKYHDVLNKDMLYVQDKCRQLLKDGRCKVYRNRPQICKVSECPIVSWKKKINWYAKNGLLKDKIEAYKEGRLDMR